MGKFRHISEILLEILPVILPNPKEEKEASKTKKPLDKEKVLTDG